MTFDYNKIKGALGEVQTLLHWDVQFINPGSAVPNDLTKDEFRIRVSTSSLPAPEVTHTEVQIQGRTIRYVGKVNKSGTISLTLFEGTDTFVLGTLFDWMNSYWDGVDGKQNLTKDLKCDVKLTLKGPNDEETMAFTLKGCLPNPQPGGDLGQESEAMQPTLELSYDDFEFDGAGTVW